MIIAAIIAEFALESCRYVANFEGIALTFGGKFAVAAAAKLAAVVRCVAAVGAFLGCGGITIAQRGDAIAAAWGACGFCRTRRSAAAINAVFGRGNAAVTHRRDVIAAAWAAYFGIRIAACRTRCIALAAWTVFGLGNTAFAYREYAVFAARGA